MNASFSTLSPAFLAVHEMRVLIERYAPKFIILFGTIGNIINLVIFRQIQLRSNPCAFYFFLSSLAGLIDLYCYPFTRILSSYGIDLTMHNPLACKLRIVSVNFFTSLSVWSISFAIIDRYHLSSTDVNQRNRSNMKNTYKAAGGLALGLFLIYAPLFYCYDANRPVPEFALPCNPISQTCFWYYTTSMLLTMIFAPLILMLLFGYLTIINVRKLCRPKTKAITTDASFLLRSSSFPIQLKRKDRQFLRILFIQIFLLTVSFIPFALMQLYSTATRLRSKSIERITVEYFIYDIFGFLPFIAVSMTFYVFTLTGKLFREIFIQLLKSFFKNVIYCRRRT
jgi:hypothetical protein